VTWKKSDSGGRCTKSRRGKMTGIKRMRVRIRENPLALVASGGFSPNVGTPEPKEAK
jgi:hypothetical protein